MASVHPETTEKCDSLVCFCYRLTAEKLKQEYALTGSLAALQEKTRAGMGCGGCRIVLHSQFGETPQDPSDKRDYHAHGTPCVKPGGREQKGFIIADGTVESTIVASNAVAPSLGECNSTVDVHYSLINQKGLPVHFGKKTVSTNDTFILETKELDIPRPFYGMLHMSIHRGNLGAWRYNIYWSNGKARTSTHESGLTGRYRAFIPFIVDKRFLEGPNVIYAGVMNCFGQINPMHVEVFDTQSEDYLSWSTEMQPYCSTFLNLNDHFYKKALKRFGDRQFGLRMNMNADDPSGCISVYFFVHNKETDIWACNHL